MLSLPHASTMYAQMHMCAVVHKSKSRAMMRLCTWNCISDAELDEVFSSAPDCSDEKRQAAKHLIRLCLNGDPAQRPTLEQVCQHPFVTRPKSTATSPTKSSLREELHTEHVEIPVSPINGQVLAPLKARSAARMVYHVFISHMQAEVLPTTHTHAHERTHASTHARTHARMCARTHTSCAHTSRAYTHTPHMNRGWAYLFSGIR